MRPRSLAPSSTPFVHERLTNGSRKCFGVLVSVTRMHVQSECRRKPQAILQVGPLLLIEVLVVVLAVMIVVVEVNPPDLGFDHSSANPCLRDPVSLGERLN